MINNINNKINGILLLDKNSGITSNKALQQIKYLFNKLFANKNKLGHTGSLDPLATGMLPICCGEATKFSAFLLNANKKYLVTALLGVKTDTGDTDGNIISQEEINYNFTTEQINNVLATFIGKTSQTPPIFSAIKQNGVRLYKLARQKQSIVIQPRFINIYNIKLLEICNHKKLITFEVLCSKGTYIRSLVEDLAKKLDCLATVSALRRISVGDFHNKPMFTAEKLENILYGCTDITARIMQLNKLLLPVEACLSNLPVLKLNEQQIKSLYHGKIVNFDDTCINADLFCLINNNNELLGVGERVDQNNLTAKRLVSFN